MKKQITPGPWCVQKIEDSEEFDLFPPSLKQMVSDVLSKVYGDK